VVLLCVVVTNRGVAVVVHQAPPSRTACRLDTRLCYTGRSDVGEGGRSPAHLGGDRQIAPAARPRVILEFSGLQAAAAAAAVAESAAGEQQDRDDDEDD